MIRSECNGDAQDAGNPANVVGTDGNHGDVFFWVLLGVVEFVTPELRC